MKLRIKGNSLRLRISRSELARLLAGDCVEEQSISHQRPARGSPMPYSRSHRRRVRRYSTQTTECRFYYRPIRRMCGV
jgi:hypothetical protein